MSQLRSEPAIECPLASTASGREWRAYFICPGQHWWVLPFCVHRTLVHQLAITFSGTPNPSTGEGSCLTRSSWVNLSKY